MKDFLRHVNLVWAVLGIWLCGVVGAYLLDRWRDEELHLLRSQLAMSILVFFGFDTLLRWRIWWFLVPGTSAEIDWTVPFCSFGATVGMVCMCRILAPTRWGAWRWIAPALMLFGAAVFSQWWIT